MSRPPPTRPLSGASNAGTVTPYQQRRQATQRSFHQAAGAGSPDIYTKITARIIADLEQGVRPWARPWNVGHLDGRIMRPLRYNGLPYSGINVLMLWLAAEEHGFTSPTWMTYKQALELGGHVRKGEHGTPVVYANTFAKTEQDSDGQDVTRTIPYLKTYTVFCADQIEGLPTQYRARPEERSYDRPGLLPPEKRHAALAVSHRAEARRNADSLSSRIIRWSITGTPIAHGRLFGPRLVARWALAPFG